MACSETPIIPETTPAEYINYYVGMLIIQYYNKPLARARIELIAQEYEKVFSALNGVLSNFNIDTATGDLLDKIGSIVGMPRTLPFSPYGTGLNDLNDDLYRFYIRAKIAVNNCKAVTSNKYNGLSEIYRFIFGYNSLLIDNKNMSITLYIEDTIYYPQFAFGYYSEYCGYNEGEWSFDPDILPFFNTLGLLPKPNGVRIILVKWNKDNYFGFEDDPNAKGWDVGEWADYISL